MKNFEITQRKILELKEVEVQDVTWVLNVIRSFKEYYTILISAVESGEFVSVESDVIELFANFLYGDGLMDFLPVEKIDKLALNFKKIIDVSKVYNDVSKLFGYSDKFNFSRCINNLDMKFKSIMLAKDQYDYQVWLDEIYVLLFLNRLRFLKEIKVQSSERNALFWFLYDVREELFAISNKKSKVMIGILHALDCIVKRLIDGSQGSINDSKNRYGNFKKVQAG